MSDMCLRTVEFRATTDDGHGDGRTMEGYAAVFDTPTRINSWEGSFNEQITRGAFSKSLQARTPVLQFDHGHDARTGSVPIGAFEQLSEDASGLFVRARLYDNPVVEPIRQAIEGGSISGMSIRFAVTGEDWTDEAGDPVSPRDVDELLWTGRGGVLNRNITGADLFEAGPVVFPAYETTSVGVRSLVEKLTDRDIQELAALLRKHPAFRLDAKDDAARALANVGKRASEIKVEIDGDAIVQAIRRRKAKQDDDPTDIPVASDVRNADGEELDAERQEPEASTSNTHALKRARALRIRGI